MFPCGRTLSTHGDIAYECSWTVSRNALQTHTSHCPYTALEGFFRIPDARAAVPKTESVRLRAMLDAAEGTHRNAARDSAIFAFHFLAVRCRRAIRSDMGGMPRRRGGAGHRIGQ